MKRRAELIFIGTVAAAYLAMTIVFASRDTWSAASVSIILGLAAVACLIVAILANKPQPPVLHPGPRGTTTQHPEALGWPDTSDSSPSPSGDRTT